MIVMLDAGAFRVMCKHLQLKGNTYYYRRRIPEDVRSLYKHLGRRADEQMFFSLKTTDKMEACRRADAHTRRLDALWKAHREGNKTAVDPHVALATLEVAGMSPGDAVRYPDHPAISDFVDRLIGQHEPHEPSPRITPQDKLTLDILYGAPVPKLLSDARAKHFELGKGPKGKVAEAQFERAWNLLMDIVGDVPLDHLRREHGNEFVRRLVEDQGVGPEATRRTPRLLFMWDLPTSSAAIQPPHPAVSRMSGTRRATPIIGSTRMAISVALPPAPRWAATERMSLTMWSWRAALMPFWRPVGRSIAGISWRGVATTSSRR